jgi:hypothetical protein
VILPSKTGHSLAGARHFLLFSGSTSAASKVTTLGPEGQLIRHVSFRSIAIEMGCPRDVRFALEADRTADIGSLELFHHDRAFADDDEGDDEISSVVAWAGSFERTDRNAGSYDPGCV